MEDIHEKTGFARNAAIEAAKEAVNENDETRKRFEVLAREAFKKFKACLMVKGINNYRHTYDAINIIYKSLQKDREEADITEILRSLHQVVDEVITTTAHRGAGKSAPYDISKIDFDRLRKEFERSKVKRTTVQNLKQVLEERLSRLIAQNPLRTNLQRHYEELVEAYNREKDRVTIEKTFEALLKFVEELDDESRRAVREGLTEESLALFDLLLKPGLSKQDTQRIKKVAGDLLATLKAERPRIENWQEKEATRDAVRVAIQDFLWDDRSGLPSPAYNEDDIKVKTDDIFRHVYRVYPTLPSPFFAA